MPRYHRLGDLPAKRHQIFRKPDGALHTEELMGNMGFTGPSSLLYHLRPPTAIERVGVFQPMRWEKASDEPAKHRHFQTQRLEQKGDMLTDRVPLLFNNDVALLAAYCDEGVTGFYRNAQGDEVVYAAEGKGSLESPFGRIAFRSGDYLVIPRGIVHRYACSSSCRFLVIESAGFVRTPRRYRNEFGQLIEGSPYSERDIRVPTDLEAHDEQGEFAILVKKSSGTSELVLRHHPFDVVGWDGFYYPWAFSIHDFEPRVGRFHLPPPVHQTFEGDGFVICSFCPRPYDFDSTSIPAPYNHSNVMSDEVIFYANSEFMSRKGISYGSITLHPDGLAHGPQPGRTEASIGKARTDELAVMVDTFRGLSVSRPALDIEDRDYHRSWVR